MSFDLQPTLIGPRLLLRPLAAGAAIGSARYSFQFAASGEVEIGWTFLARDLWGGSANREIKRLMLRHAFGSLATAMFRVGEQNLRSRRALEKIGARLSDRTQRANLAGREVVHIIYTIERGDFQRSPLALEGDG